jgi:rod shape determining protein RodA
MILSGFFKSPEIPLVQKLGQVSWGLVAVITVIACVGFAMLYSAGNGNLHPWASRQMARFLLGLALMIGLALVDIRVWMRNAYVLYLGTLALLAAVEFIGSTGMGAQRWISLGPVNIQPSELMKIALVIVLARYFHSLPDDAVTRMRFLIWPAVLTLLPAAMVLRQPDLGTAVMLLMIGAAVFFMAGVRLWKFALIAGLGLGAIPIGWQFLKPYQKQRILTFLDPESDPLGSGYHILQSKIALGSGGLTGKGFLHGSQAHLNFLPEKQTDFIFTMLAEEFGLAGGIVLLALYSLVLAYGFFIALRCHNQFGRLVAMGVTAAFFLYIFINIAMVMGLIPVVGVPLPLISYGGTSMVTLMMGFGILIGVHVHRDITIGRAELGLGRG